LTHLPSILQIAGLVLAIAVAAALNPLLGVAALAIALFTVGLALERR
jgi:hypothetical protein